MERAGGVGTGAPGPRGVRRACAPNDKPEADRQGGARTGKRLSGEAGRLLVRQSGHRVRVKASCHVVRHSYATHLLQGGANVRQI